MYRTCAEKRVHAAAILTAACLAVSVGGCSSTERESGSDDEWVSRVVTADIEAGIRDHIDEQTRLGGGFFPLVVKGDDLKLKLVKIHTEYLATLGPRQHFACVDLVDTRGDVYDVDFFMFGDPGSMVVTKTMPHKVNGKPFYFWKQNEDETWGRVSADEASQELMGVIIPADEFEFRYRFTLPEINDTSRLWIPLPQSDAFQTVELVTVKAPHDYRVARDGKNGNEAMYWELVSADTAKTIDIRYKVKRVEKSAYEDKAVDAARYLAPDAMVPNDERFKSIALKATEGKTGDLQKARALYDLVIDEVRYAKAGKGWGQGDAQFACDARHGNCTDFHAYFTALARSIGIPARFAIGAAIPSSRDDGGVDGYHCWVEFYAEGKWWPVDISEADKYSALATYYFGHHPANRIEFSRGRDIEFDPGPQSGPINFFAYPLLEANGETSTLPVSFTFRRQGGRAGRTRKRW